MQVTAFALRKLVRTKRARPLLARYSQGRPTQQLTRLTYAELKGLIAQLKEESRDLAAVPAALPGAPLPPRSSRDNAPAALAAVLTSLLLQHRAQHTPDGQLAAPAAYRQLLYALSSDHTSDTILISHESAYEALLQLVQDNALGKLSQHQEQAAAVVKDASSIGKLLMSLQHGWADDAFAPASPGCSSASCGCGTQSLAARRQSSPPHNSWMMQLHKQWQHSRLRWHAIQACL